MTACSSARRDIHHHLFTTVPKEFFAESLCGIPFDYHLVECDVGMAQQTPLMEDVDGTLRALDRLPFPGSAGFDELSKRVKATGCRLIVSDIAPLGLAIADRLAMPGILVENFTWDWIYRAYPDTGLGRYGDRFAEFFSSAELRIQTEPVCRFVEGCVSVAPVSRRTRRPRKEIRDHLGLREDQPVVLLSQSGIDLSPSALETLGRRFDAMTFIVPGARVERVETDGPVIRVPFCGSLFHPDLVQASDVVVAKLGYSTVAEVYHAATALAYFRRPHFPESPILEAFVREETPSVGLSEDWLEHPSTKEMLEDLLEAPRPRSPRPNGAGLAAGLILDMPQLRY